MLFLITSLLLSINRKKDSWMDEEEWGEGVEKEAIFPLSPSNQISGQTGCERRLMMSTDLLLVMIS